MSNLIIVRGPIGAGKSSLSNAVAEHVPDCSVVESDALKRILDPTQSSAWRRNAANAGALAMTESLLRDGRSVITETHTRWPAHTEQFMALADRLSNVALTTVLVTAPLEVCLGRARARYVPGISYAIDDAMVREYYTNFVSLPDELQINTANIDTATATSMVLQRLRLVETEGALLCVE